MKKILLILPLLWAVSSFGQNEKVVVETNDDGTRVKIGRSGNVSVQETDEATRIRMGSTEINIADDNVNVDFWKERKFDKFRGNWAGVELGLNGYTKQSYEGYKQKGFMDLRTAKSVTVRWNFLQFDMGLQKERRNIGLLTGLGLESKDYRFEHSYSLQNINGVTQPLSLAYDELKKSKLNVLYLTAPIIFEVQIPDANKRRFHIGFGIEGGWRIASHIKMKYKEDGKWHKNKERDNFNLNDFKLDAQLRLGYGGFHLFFNYGLIDLFEKNKGPELSPFTVGITLITF